MSFRLTDVREGETVLRGKSNAGRTIEGRVTEILPGIGFRVRGTNNQESIIWGEYELVGKESVSSTSIPEVDEPSTPNDIGYPDCEFWAANDVEPLYVASPYHYSGTMRIPPPGSLVQPLLANREKAERLAGAYLQAWTRQIADCLTLLPECSPHRRDSASASVPNAPVKEALHIEEPSDSVTVCKKLFTDGEDEQKDCSECCGCDKDEDAVADEDADTDDDDVGYDGDGDGDKEDDDEDDEESDDDDADDAGYYGDRAKYMAICDYLTASVSVPIVAVLAALLLPLILSSPQKPCLC